MIELFKKYLFTGKNIYNTSCSVLYKCDGNKDEMITAMANVASNDDT